MNFQAFAVVIDEPQTPKLVHEKAHPRARRADHLCQGFLADLGDERLRPPFFAEICEQQKKPRKTLFARVEELVHEILFDSHGASQEMRHEDLRERRLVIEHAHDGRFLEPHDRAFRHRPDGRDPPRLSGQAALTAELLRSKNCDDRLFPLPGNDSDFELALLDVEHGVRGIALLEDSLILAILGYGSALADLGRERTWDRTP